MSRKTWLFLTFFILLSVLAAGVLYYLYDRNINQPLDPDSQETVTFTILPGTSGPAVIQKLKENNLIRSTIFTRIFFRLQQERGNFFQAGEFQISPSQSLAQIYQLFLHGTFDTQIIIPEGKRLEEISEIIGRELDISPQEFFITAQDSRGFLFPDTYIVPRDISASQLKNLMVETFHDKVESKLEKEFHQQGLSLYQAVTLASIVEREAKLDRDRGLIAGILIKRLKNNWRLEADATVQFAKAAADCQIGRSCQWWANQLTAQDLEIDSPYNTRKNSGT